MIIRHNNHTIELHDSVKETSADRFNTYNLNVLLDAGIGSDLQGLNNRIDTCSRLMRAGRNEEAAKELENFRQLIYFIMGKTNPRNRSFVCLIRRLNGRVIRDEDLTEDGISQLLEEINRTQIPQSKIRAVLDDLKLRFAQQWETLTPTTAVDPATKDLYTRLKERTLLVLQHLREPIDEIAERIAEIDAYLLDSLEPRQYSGAAGIEAQTLRRFEDSCILLRQFKVHEDPRKMSAFAFQQALAIVKEQVKHHRKK